MHTVLLPDGLLWIYYQPYHCPNINDVTLKNMVNIGWYPTTPDTNNANKVWMVCIFRRSFCLYMNITNCLQEAKELNAVFTFHVLSFKFVSDHNRCHGIEITFCNYHNDHNKCYLIQQIEEAFLKTKSIEQFFTLMF